VVEVVEAEPGRLPWQDALVHGQRVLGRIVAAHPQVVVAGDERLAARQVGEQLEALGEGGAGADVAGQDQHVGRVAAQVPGQQACLLAALAMPPVQVRRDGQTQPRRHAPLLRWAETE
jgi:hypothetical protein